MMRKRGSIAIAGAIAAGLMAAGIGAAAADDRGNHGPIWGDAQHGSLESGTQWGPTIGGLANTGGLKPTGVSEGVHLAKNQPVPGQNK